MNGPFGWFKLKDATSPVVFFAAGVGITPIRALLLSLRADTSRDIEIVYASGGQYLFGEEIEGIVRDNPKMTLYKTTDPESTRTQLAALAATQPRLLLFRGTGDPVCTTSLAAPLKRIIDDTFRGYQGFADMNSRVISPEAGTFELHKDCRSTPIRCKSLVEGSSLEPPEGCIVAIAASSLSPAFYAFIAPCDRETDRDENDKEHPAWLGRISILAEP